MTEVEEIGNVAELKGKMLVINTGVRSILLYDSNELSLKDMQKLALSTLRELK